MYWLFIYVKLAIDTKYAQSVDSSKNLTQNTWNATQSMFDLYFKSWENVCWYDGENIDAHGRAFFFYEFCTKLGVTNVQEAINHRKNGQKCGKTWRLTYHITIFPALSGAVMFALVKCLSHQVRLHTLRANKVSSSWSCFEKFVQNF